MTPYRSLVRTVAPASQPFTTAVAKAHCRVDTDDDDTYIDTLVDHAVAYVESILGIGIVSQTWAARYDGFPAWNIELPREPLTSGGTVTISYVDLNGTTQTLSSATSDFVVDRNSSPPCLRPNYTSTWPATRSIENAVTVTFIVGYAAVPGEIARLLYMLVAHWYEVRQPVLVGYSQALPVPHTIDTLISASGKITYRGPHES